MYSCSQCDCSEFDIVDGYYFCVSCGAQSQYSEQHMNNEDEDASLFMDVSSSDSKSKVEDHVKFTPEQLMLNAYTKVMQLQADALIACGFPESVKTAICILWFDYVKDALLVKRASSILLDIERAEEFDEDNQEQLSDCGSTSKNKLALVNPQVTLSICYFACMKCSCTVLLSDIYRLLKMGHLPYFANDPLFCNNDDPSLAKFYSGSSLFSLSHLYWMFGRLAELMSFEDFVSIKPVFVLTRFWVDLNLPSELFKAAVFVLRQISFDTDTQWSNFCPKFRSDRPKIPLETQVMAVLIVVLKLLFGLNDQHELYGFVNLYIEEFKFLTLTNMILSSSADDNEVEGGNFSLLQWLLHNELKTAILKGQPVEEVLGLRWSDASRKVTNILEKLRRPSAVQRTENFFNPVLCPIFREVSSTADELLVSLPPVCFLMKTLPLYLAESVSKSRTPLDSSNVVLFGIDFSKKKTAFSSATWTSRSDFPFWNESYCRYPQIPATHRDSSAFAFNQMCFRLFSSTFYRLLALCCSYINERDKVLFKAVQMIEKCLFQDMKHVSSKWQLQ
ncbi:TATA box-binding protein-associated factor RNA polymerase I subunit B [Trichinella pseudospiralis]|uniref:TATA box-binding protein-associated factor RNA polymerase I subunit B n=1 Tax=Trichinella pseudospiralis TaxID=6337 RepID=A0A0V0YLC2_TRIPS|nr:TATA box-binding protein-associated factor RNA polymerase I subunit B [Trichinella pseudospiralis]